MPNPKTDLWAYEEEHCSILEHTYGDVRVVAFAVTDDDGDYHDEEIKTSNKSEDSFGHLAYVFHRRESVMHLPGAYWDHPWRDEHGRFVQAPEYSQWMREDQFLHIQDNGQGFKCAYQQALRQERLYNGVWGYIGIVTRLYIGDAYLQEVDVTEDSCWGFESDSDNRYLRSEARHMIKGLIKTAQGKGRQLNLGLTTQSA